MTVVVVPYLSFSFFDGVVSPPEITRIEIVPIEDDEVRSIISNAKKSGDLVASCITDLKLLEDVSRRIPELPTRLRNVRIRLGPDQTVIFVRYVRDVGTQFFLLRVAEGG